MKYLLLLIKGFLIGLAKIIPGVSGAVLSISLGVYERLIEIIGHPFKIKWDDLKFLMFLLFGAAIGILVLCDGIKWGLSNFYASTMMLFIGLIVGGLPEIINDINKDEFKFSNYVMFILSFSFILIITSLNKSPVNSSNHFFMMGFIESLTTIIPGISGTAIFMALGWYESLLSLLKNILTFNASLSVSFYFILGFAMATILISKIISFVFKKYKSKSYFCVLGFMSGSLWTMFDNIFSHNFNVFVGIVLFFLGIIITYNINNLFSKF